MSSTECGPAAREGLFERALAVVDAGTTDMADHPLEVPLDYYRSPEQFECEMAMLGHTPLALTSTAQLRAPHDYVVREALGTSVLITRNGDGRVRSFVNHCRHRGARPAEGCGSARRFTCPYHAWTYDNDGRLVGVPGQDGFEPLDRDSYGLVELPCEERHGFVWVVLSAGAPLDLDAHLGPLDDHLEQWDIAEHEFFTEATLESPVNWKASLEAFAENYHFAYVHADSIIGQNTLTNTALFDAYGPHHRLCFPSAWIADLRGTEQHSPLGSMSLIYWIFPNLVIAVTAVGVEVIDVLPGADLGSTVLRHGLLSAEPLADDEARAGFTELFRQVHAGVVDEDFSVLPSCGDGIRHAQHEHMLIGRNEVGVQNVVRSIAAATGFELPGAPGDGATVRI